MAELFFTQSNPAEENVYSQDKDFQITKKEILIKLTEIMGDERLLTEVECLSLKRKIEKYGDTL